VRLPQAKELRVQHQLNEHGWSDLLRRKIDQQTAPPGIVLPAHSPDRKPGRKEILHRLIAKLVQSQQRVGKVAVRLAAPGHLVATQIDGDLHRRTAASEQLIEHHHRHDRLDEK